MPSGSLPLEEIGDEVKGKGLATERPRIHLEVMIEPPPEPRCRPNVTGAADLSGTFGLV